MNSVIADDLGKLILRLTLGVLILFHGYAKLTGGIDPISGMLEGAGLPGIFAYGVYLGEVIGPLMLILGLYTRAGAALVFLNMVFAIALAHSNELFALTPQGGWQLELQGMFLFSALALMFTGGGRFALTTRW